MCSCEVSNAWYEWKVPKPVMASWNASLDHVMVFADTLGWQEAGKP